MRVFFILAVFGAFLIYSTGLSAPFHLDDQNVIEISQTFGWQTRPLGFGSFWLNGQILPIVASVLPWRVVFYYRFGNILLHAIAATALFWLICELTRRVDLAAIGGALFLVHPIQTQAVTYISQRFESQAAMFMLLSAAAYARFRRTGVRGWIALAIVFGGAAGLTKETAVVLPLWLLFIEVVFFEGAQLRRWAVYMVPLGIVLAIPAWRVFRNSGQLTLGWVPYDQFALTQGPILTKYFQLALWPRRQFLFYDFQPIARITAMVVMQWVVVLAVVALGIYLLKKQRLVGFGMLTFFILLLPVIVLPLPDLINEHRLYPAFAGVAIAAAGLFQVVNRKWALAIVAVLVIAFGIKTARRNSDWNDLVHFMELHRAEFPHDPWILTRLGAYYFNSGAVNKALEANREARRYEDHVNTYYRQELHLLVALNLSGAYLAKGDVDAAKSEALRAIAAKPKEPLAWRNLGLVEIRRHENKEAQDAFRRYVELAPGPDSWAGLQAASAAVGDDKTVADVGKLIKEDEDEAAKQQAAAEPVIPKRYTGYAVFALTMGLLAVMAWAVWTLWTAARGLLVEKPSELVDKSTNFDGEI